MKRWICPTPTPLAACYMSNRTAVLQPSCNNTSDTLLELFLNQLSWLVGGAHEAKRVFTSWLLASPPPPSGPALLLAQARRLTGRHLAQLEQLLEGVALPIGTSDPNHAIAALLDEGEACLRDGGTEAQRYAKLLVSLQRISTCLGSACASAAETAMVLGRVDLAAVLASWAAAWRDLQRSIAPPATVRAPEPIEAPVEERRP
jgi:hypothetical protein